MIRQAANAKITKKEKFSLKAYENWLFLSIFAAMKPRLHIILLSCCALLLLCLGIFSISTQLRFEREAERRVKIVTESIRKIIDAEDDYCEANGHYTEHCGDLIGGGFLSDSICVIPFSDGQLFTLTYSTEKDPSGQKIQTIDCSALYQQFLNDMNHQALSELLEKSAEVGQFPGISLSHTTMLEN